MAQVTDPVCGMQLDEKDAVATVEYGGKLYHFCSEDCKGSFEEDPDDYVNKE